MASDPIEVRVGINRYVHEKPSIFGILKHRYKDFLVNEIDLRGQVVRLTNLHATDEQKKVKEIPTDSSSLLESFEQVAGTESVELLRRYLEDGRIEDTKSCSGNNKFAMLLPAPDDRQKRREIHQFFRKNFNQLGMMTDTVDAIQDGPQKVIRVYQPPKPAARDDNSANPGSKKRKRGKGVEFDDRNDSWPADRPNFVKFVMYKENKDTQDALNVIGRLLRCKPSSFGYAGTKDKRGVTTQEITLYRQKKESLARLNQTLRGIKVGNFNYVSEPLRLGDLHGNRFCIVLRNISASDQMVKTALEQLEGDGFINYFGLQRFGSGTHQVGMALLKGNWMEAIKLIMKPRENEREECAASKQYFLETMDAKGALSKMPHFLVAERAILDGFHKFGEKNLVQVLSCIPRTLQMLYVHSYQSFLWNRVASARVDMFGCLTLAEGDLVCTAGDTPSEDANIEPDQVHVVTPEDIKTKRYTVFDLVLPLPGKKMIYPQNESGALFHKLAKEEGISLNDSPHKVKMFSFSNLSGAYRRVVQRPQNVRWKVITYANGNEDLTETDFDRIKGNCIAGSDFGGDKRALYLEFSLPASCYATMAIRELTKASSSAMYHKSITVGSEREMQNSGP